MRAEFCIVSCAESAECVEPVRNVGLTVTSETLFMENPSKEPPCERSDSSLLFITAAVCAGNYSGYDVETKVHPDVAESQE